MYTLKVFFEIQGPDIFEKPFWYRFIYFNICSSGERFKYYLAWTLADVVNNASGFGFNGYDENGNEKWDLLLNVRIMEIEVRKLTKKITKAIADLEFIFIFIQLSTSFKGIVDNWHIQTTLWLRSIAFERLPSGKTLGVFVLSALWHGFYPGYYFTFILSAFLVYIGRGVSKFYDLI